MASFMRRDALGDAEGTQVDPALPFVVDAHVHLFPDRLFGAIWRWFDAHAWPIRYRLTTPEVLDHLFARGVGHVVALAYAHKPGIARGLNAYMADVCAREPRVTGLATVMPGEDEALAILDEAFDAGLAGVKLHCHVQRIAPDDPALAPIYARCAARGKPIVLHAGREPASPAYGCDAHALCSADKVERVLRDHPRLRLLVPHLGADEFDAYRDLVARHDNLWVDTTMVVADYFPGTSARRVLDFRPDRVLYGTDFPNVPYAWDRELRRLAALPLDRERLALLLGGNACDFFGIKGTSSPNAL